MTSRERLSAAARHQSTDRLPVCFRGVAPLEVNCSNRLERASYLLGLGIDDKIPVELPWIAHPDVGISQRWERQSGSLYPVIIKEYDTPAGILRQSVRQTSDFIPDDLPLRSDHAWSRGVAFPVQNEADIEKLKCTIQGSQQ